MYFMFDQASAYDYHKQAKAVVFRESDVLDSCNPTRVLRRKQTKRKEFDQHTKKVCTGLAIL